jgi:hypothetical protein
MRWFVVVVHFDSLAPEVNDADSLPLHRHWEQYHDQQPGEDRLHWLLQPLVDFDANGVHDSAHP